MTAGALATLSDICIFENGDRGKNYPGKSATLKEGVPFVSAGDLANGALRRDALAYISADQFSRLNSGKFKKGDLLFCLRGTLGKFAIIDSDIYGAIASSLVIIRPKSEIDAGYLKWFLGSSMCERQVDLYRNGAAQPNLSANSLKKFEIPLPPLDEQRRIAAVLDKADALCRQRRRAIGLLESLTSSIFMERFGDLVGSNKYSRGTIADWVEGFDSGKNLAPDPDTRTTGGYRVLKVSAVTKGIFLPGEAKLLPSSYEPPTTHFVHAGDLLFSRANTAELIGATAYVESECDNLVLPDKIWRFVWRKSNPPNPRFVHALFSTPSFRRELSKRATGTSGSMKNISKDKVLSIGVALPRRDEQEEFVSRQDALRGVMRSAVLQARLIEEQFSSLQHRAFSGQL